MKKKLTLALCLFFTFGAFAQKYDLPRKYEGLTTNIDSIQIKQYKVGSTEATRSIITVFDANGQIVKRVEKEAATTKTVNNKLDDQGRILVSKDDTYTDGKLTSSYETSYTYENSDNWVAMKTDKLKGNMVYTDATRAPGYGTTHFRKEVSAIGDITNYHVGFDAKGNLLFNKVFNDEEVWLQAVHYTYNAKNQLATRVHSALKTAKRTETFKYTETDSNGNWNKREISEKDKVTYTEVQTIFYRN